LRFKVVSRSAVALPAFACTRVCCTLRCAFAGCVLDCAGCYFAFAHAFRVPDSWITIRAFCCLPRTGLRTFVATGSLVYLGLVHWIFPWFVAKFTCFFSSSGFCHGFSVPWFHAFCVLWFPGLVRLDGSGLRFFCVHGFSSAHGCSRFSFLILRIPCVRSSWFRWHSLRHGFHGLVLFS